MVLKILFLSKLCYIKIQWRTQYFALSRELFQIHDTFNVSNICICFSPQWLKDLNGRAAKTPKFLVRDKNQLIVQVYKLNLYISVRKTGQAFCKSLLLFCFLVYFAVLFMSEKKVNKSTINLFLWLYLT